MAKYINVKAPNARKAEDFIVYPFTAGEQVFRLQSEHRFMIVDLSANTLSYSKRIANYPNTHHCQKSFGGNTVELPKELKQALIELTPDASHCVALGAKSHTTHVAL